MIVRCFRKTISGLPGKLASCNRKRYPRAWSNRRTAISGFVSFARMSDITCERFFAVKTS
jgi:hypothetical protein